MTVVEEDDKKRRTLEEAFQLGQEVVTPDEYEAATGEKLGNTLDLNTWIPGEDLAGTYERLEREIVEGKAQEDTMKEGIRKDLFPKLKTRRNAPKDAGLWRASLERLEDVHFKLLFNGGVEACDGTRVTYDTLPVTITQIGVCLVSYRGDQGTWGHRIFRRDLRTKGKVSTDEIMALLERRKKRDALGVESKRDILTDLGQRGIMSYAERAVLFERSNATWRMGHGSPIPWELLTGSGMPELAIAGMDLMRRMIQGHQRFVYLVSAPQRHLAMMGNALRPLEYVVVDNSLIMLESLIGEGHYRGEGWDRGAGNVKQALNDFKDDCGTKVVMGLYRASWLAPPQVFYAHEDHVHEAVLIAMADSVLQEHRGFPMLIDLADNMCKTMFGADHFEASIQLAYAAAGDPFSYLSERQTRRR